MRKGDTCNRLINNFRDITIGEFDALMRDVMALSRRRSALVKLKYKDNPNKLAAWAIALHLEQPPHKKPSTK